MFPRAFSPALVSLLCAANVSAGPALIGQSSAPANTGPVVAAPASRPNTVAVAPPRSVPITGSQTAPFIGGGVGGRHLANGVAPTTIRPPAVVRPTTLTPPRVVTIPSVGAPLPSQRVVPRQPVTNPALPTRLAPIASSNVGPQSGVASAAAAARAAAANSSSRRRWTHGRRDYYPSVDYFPGQSFLQVNAGQFLYPSAYGYALPGRNEYTAPVNPYFPGLAYSQFTYPIVYYYSAAPPETRNPAPPSAAPDPAATEEGSLNEPAGNDPNATSGPNRSAQSTRPPLPNEPNSLLEAVQTELAHRGYYPGQPDGLPGPATTEAIRRFQTDLRLRPTGKVNQATLFALGLN